MRGVGGRFGRRLSSFNGVDGYGLCLAIHGGHSPGSVCGLHVPPREATRRARAGAGALLCTVVIVEECRIPAQGACSELTPATDTGLDLFTLFARQAAPCPRFPTVESIRQTRCAHRTQETPNLPMRFEVIVRVVDTRILTETCRFGSPCQGSSILTDTRCEAHRMHPVMSMIYNTSVFT